jgi:hypothetical protein
MIETADQTGVPLYRATRPPTCLRPGTLLLRWRTPAGARSPDIARAVAAARPPTWLHRRDWSGLDDQVRGGSTRTP